MSELAPLPSEVLPAGIRARFVSGINGLRMHILEAGSAAPGRPAILLLHGFPELAYSWRKIMPTLAAAGFHVIAPDQRGYGRTTGWSANYDDDLRPFRLLNAVATHWGWLRRSATARSRPSSGTISAPRSRPGARWFDPTCSGPSR